MASFGILWFLCLHAPRLEKKHQEQISHFGFFLTSVERKKVILIGRMSCVVVYWQSHLYYFKEEIEKFLTLFYDTIIVYRYVMWYDGMPLRIIIDIYWIHLNAAALGYFVVMESIKVENFAANWFSIEDVWLISLWKWITGN